MVIHKFDVHVTVHRNKFLIIKPTRCTNFSYLFLEWNSTRFGQFLCPSSGVFHSTHSNGICHTGLLTACEQDQDVTAVPSWSCSQPVSKPVWHMPLLCVQRKTPDDGQRNCPKHVEFHSKSCSSILILLASCQQTCMTYTIAVCAVKNSWWWTEELSETCRVSFQELQFHPDPASKLSANLYDLYHCCVCSEKLLMMDRGTVRNTLSFIPRTAVPSRSCSQAVSKPVWHISLLCVLWKTPDDGQRNCPKHVEFHSKNKCEKLMHLVGFIIRR